MSLKIKKLSFFGGLLFCLLLLGTVISFYFYVQDDQIKEEGFKKSLYNKLILSFELDESRRAICVDVNKTLGADFNKELDSIYLPEQLEENRKIFRKARRMCMFGDGKGSFFKEIDKVKAKFNYSFVIKDYESCSDLVDFMDTYRYTEAYTTFFTNERKSCFAFKSEKVRSSVSIFIKKLAQKIQKGGLKLWKKL